MFKSILFTSLLLFVSSKTFAAFIYADDFAVGQNVSHLTSNATLSWLEGTGKRSESTIFAPGTFYHKHFGGLTTAATATTFPGLHSELMGSPNPQQYTALEIDFGAAVRSFGFKVENHSGDIFSVYTFDTQGNFVEMISTYLARTEIVFPDGAVGYWPIWDGSTMLNFDYDVGMIKMGSTDSAAYIYALDVEVPEPSPILLLAAGLLFIFAARKNILMGVSH
ncbi:MAG: PEP-CTERM sorting domain-containing protein [Pseudomonadota bacterium]